MINLYRQFQQSGDLERDGVTFVIQGGKFKLARAGGTNDLYTRAIARSSKRVNNVNNPLSEDEAKTIMIQAYADSIVKDWEGVSDENGEPLTCTRENIVKVLTDLPEFFAVIREQADNAEHFRLHQLNEISEQLGKSQPGNCDTGKKPRGLKKSETADNVLTY